MRGFHRTYYELIQGDREVDIEKDERARIEIPETDPEDAQYGDKDS